MINIERFEVNYFSENTYVLFDETKEAVIIDCGCLRDAEKQRVSRFIEQNNLVLKRNLCTHLHLDHIFGNEYIYSTYGISPEANEADEIVLPSAEEQSRAFGLPVAVKDVPLKGYLKDGDKIVFGNSELEVIALPGHTPGGIAFFSAADNFVIVGDSLFAGSIGRTDLWGGNQNTLVSSLRKRIMTLPDDTKVFPGHGPATTVKNEKEFNPYI